MSYETLLPTGAVVMYQGQRGVVTNATENHIVVRLDDRTVHLTINDLPHILVVTDD